MSDAEVLYEEGRVSAWETCPFFWEIGLLLVSKPPCRHTIDGGHALSRINLGSPPSREDTVRRRGGSPSFYHGLHSRPLAFANDSAAEV